MLLDNLGLTWPLTWQIGSQQTFKGSQYTRLATDLARKKKKKKIGEMPRCRLVLGKLALNWKGLERLC